MKHDLEEVQCHACMHRFDRANLLSSSQSHIRIRIRISFISVWTLKRCETTLGYDWYAKSNQIKSNQIDDSIQQTWAPATGVQSYAAELFVAPVWVWLHVWNGSGSSPGPLSGLMTFQNVVPHRWAPMTQHANSLLLVFNQNQIKSNQIILEATCQVEKFNSNRILLAFENGGKSTHLLGALCACEVKEGRAMEPWLAEDLGLELADRLALWIKESKWGIYSQFSGSSAQG
jgi:hypothetical protein